MLAQLWRTIIAGVRWLWARPAVLAGAVGALIGAVAMVRSRENQIGRLKDAFEAQRIKSAVAKDEAKAELLTEQADVHADEVMAIRAQITASKRRAAELAHARSLEDASDEEIAKLFRDSGL
jgi:flagellar biosynthesis/type III secretory pathway M-ring protein FliF/YscJ